MNEHVTLMHPDARDPTARAISSGFPVDLLSQSAGRLRVLALLYAFVFFMAGIFPTLLFPADRARSAGNSSVGKIPAMKKTNAYSRARTRRRPADWLSRSTGNPDEIARAVGSRASGCMRVTCSFMPGLSLGAGYRR